MKGIGGGSCNLWWRNYFFTDTCFWLRPWEGDRLLHFQLLFSLPSTPSLIHCPLNIIRLTPLTSVSIGPGPDKRDKSSPLLAAVGVSVCWYASCCKYNEDTDYNFSGTGLLGVAGPGSRCSTYAPLGACQRFK